MEGTITGAHLAHMQAFSLYTWMKSSWNRCAVVLEMDNPSLCHCRWPIDLMVSTGSWLLAGILMWSSLLFVCHTEHMTLQLGDRLSWIVNICKGEMPVASRAAGLPCFQQRRYRSQVSADSRNWWWHFLPGSQGSRLGSSKQGIPEWVMEIDAVAIITTTHVAIP